MTRHLLLLLCICLLISSASADGRLIITIRAGGSAEDLEVHLANRLGVTDVTVLPDGRLDLVVAPDTYIGFLDNGNAGQLEIQEAKVGANSTGYMNFLGHAVAKVTPRSCKCGWNCSEPTPEPTPVPTPVPTPTPTPTPVPECHRVYHPEINHTETRPEHIEHIYKTWNLFGWEYWYPWADGHCSDHIPAPWSEPGTDYGITWCIEREAGESTVLVVDRPAWSEVVCREVR